MSKKEAAAAFFKSLGATPPAAKGAKVVVKTGSTSDDADGGNGGGDDRERAKNKIRKLNKHYRTELTKLEEAYNNAEEGSQEQLTADMKWYATQKGWIKQYKELAPEAGLKLTAEDDAWISYVDENATLAEKKWNQLTETGRAVPSEDDDPAVESVDKPDQGTPTAAKSFAERQQKLAAETEAAQYEVMEVDRKLAKIEWLRSNNAPLYTTQNAELVADEDDLKKERAALSDRIVASTRKYAELGGGNEGVPARSAAPLGQGYAAARGTVLARPIAGRAGGVGHLLAAGRALATERKAAPSGYLVAPTPPGGASPEALAELTRRRDELEELQEARETEIGTIRPNLERMGEESAAHVPRARHPLRRDAADSLAARKMELTKLHEEDDFKLQQMSRGISRMKSVLTDESE